MPLHGGDLFSRRRFPQACSGVVRRRHDALAIGTERRDPHHARVASQGGDLFSRHRIPQARGHVIRRGHDALAIGAERRDCDGCGMALQHCTGAALEDCPRGRRPKLGAEIGIEAEVPGKQHAGGSQPQRVLTVAVVQRASAGLTKARPTMRRCLVSSL
jgi:hypothetical protein